MGIKNLLPELKNCTEHCHISKFRGKKLGIDGFVWLHKASYFCAKDLFYLPGTKKIMPYLTSKLKILLDNEIQPFFVFDGRSLPIKSNVNDARRQIRDQAIQKITKLRQEGKLNQISSADYNAAVSIKYETVKTFINFLKKNKISFIVAPYEADAQLAYLARANYVDLILTEDSDLIAYGVPQILLKMNFDGYVDSIKSRDAISLFHFNDTNNPSHKSGLIPPSANFSTFTRIENVSENDYNDFLTFCILSGCDYAPHIKSVGPKTALSLVKKNHSNIDAILKELALNKKVVVPPNYKQAFEKAKKTFLFQKVYNIDLKTVVPLSPLLVRKSDDVSIEDFDFEFAGKSFNGKVLKKHIRGEIDSHHHDTKSGKDEEEIKDDDDDDKDSDFDYDNLDDDDDDDDDLDGVHDDDDSVDFEYDDDEDDSINEYFLPFTKGYHQRTRSELVIPFYRFDQMNSFKLPNKTSKYKNWRNFAQHKNEDNNNVGDLNSTRTIGLNYNNNTDDLNDIKIVDLNYYNNAGGLNIPGTIGLNNNTAGLNSTRTFGLNYNNNAVGLNSTRAVDLNYYNNAGGLNIPGTIGLNYNNNAVGLNSTRAVDLNYNNSIGGLNSTRTFGLNYNNNADEFNNIKIVDLNYDDSDLSNNKTNESNKNNDFMKNNQNYLENNNHINQNSNNSDRNKALFEDNNNTNKNKLSENNSSHLDDNNKNNFNNNKCNKNATNNINDNLYISRSVQENGNKSKNFANKYIKNKNIKNNTNRNYKNDNRRNNNCNIISEELNNVRNFSSDNDDDDGYKRISFLIDRDDDSNSSDQFLNNSGKQNFLSNPFQQMKKMNHPRNSRSNHKLRRCMSFNSNVFNAQPVAPSFVNPKFFVFNE